MISTYMDNEQQGYCFVIYQTLQLKYISQMKKSSQRQKSQNEVGPIGHNDYTSARYFTDDKIRRIQINQQFASIISEVLNTNYFKTRPRHTKIKLQNWLQILSKPQFNLIWRANKLNHLKLLNLMCQCQYLTRPFTSFPKHSFLPILQKHQINQIIDQVERQVKSMRYRTKKGRQNQSFTHNQNRKNANHALKHIQSDNLEKELRKNKSKLSIGHNICPIQRKTQINHENVISAGKGRAKKIQNTAYQKYEMINYGQDDISTMQRKSLSYNSRFGKKRFLKKTNNNSILESIDLFNQASLSSQIWTKTHQQKDLRSKTIDIKMAFKKSMDHSQRSYQSSQLHLNKHNLEIDCSEKTKTHKRQYWESNTYTGNVTPKYLNDIKHANEIKLADQTEIITYRSSEKGFCECIKEWWGGPNKEINKS